MRYLLLLVLVGCGPLGEQGKQSYLCMRDGEGCRGNSSQLRDGSQDSSTGIPGPAGPQGASGSSGTNGAQGSSGTEGAVGTAGSDGYSIVSREEIILVDDVICPTGGIRLRLARDLNRNGILDNSDDQQEIASICNGNKGAQGQQGVAGTAGQSGRDGANGTNGTDAPPTPFTPVAVIDPCGDKPGLYDEVFFRLANGMLVASFSDNPTGNNTRFSVLTAGSYVTTDGSKCYFSVDASGQLYNEHY